MDILQLEYFCSAAELENFTLAAKRHMIPQSAISITIKRLETELSKPLFNRNGNRIQLNDAGRKFYAHAKNCLTEFRNAKESIQSEDVGEVRLLVLEERPIIASIVCKFKELYPNIRFSICHNPLEHPNFMYDIRVNSSSKPNKDFVSTTVMTETFALAVSNKNPLSSKDHVLLKELANENFIMYPSAYSGAQLLIEACAAKGFVPNTSVICSEAGCMRQYVVANLGVAVVPHTAWKRMQNDYYALIPLENNTLVRKTKLECRKSSLTSDAVQTFREFCIEKLKRYDESKIL